MPVKSTALSCTPLKRAYGASQKYGTVLHTPLKRAHGASTFCQSKVRHCLISGQRGSHRKPRCYVKRISLEAGEEEVGEYNILITVMSRLPVHRETGFPVNHMHLLGNELGT